MNGDLVRQAVYLKTRLHNNRLLGRYEYAYACGVACCLLNQTMNSYEQYQQILDAVILPLKAYEPKNELEKSFVHLVEMSSRIPEEQLLERDEEADRLFEQGCLENPFSE